MAQQNNQNQRFIDSRGGNPQVNQVTQTPSNAQGQSFPRRVREAVQAQNPQFGFVQDDQQRIDEGAALMTWTPQEYEFQEKEENWYLTGGITAAIFIAGAIVFRNYLMAVTFFLLAVVIYIYAERKPKRILVELKEFGIRVNTTFYKYRDLTKFWIVYRPGDVKTLNIETNNVFNPVVAIQIENQDPNQIREILKEKLFEDLDHQESRIDQMARNLRL